MTGETRSYGAIADEFYQNEQWEEAAFNLEKYLSIKPGDYGAWYNLAVSYGKLKKYDQSSRCWARFLEVVEPVAEENKTQVDIAKRMINSCKYLDAASGRDPEKESGFVKFYPQGRFSVSLSGSKEYMADALDCLTTGGVCNIFPKVDAVRFREELSVRKIPSEIIDEYIESIFIDDDTYVMPKQYS